MEVDSGDRLIFLSCVIVSSLIFYSSKSDCMVSGFDSAAFNIQKNFRESVRFNCTTDSTSSVDWLYQKTSESNRVNIFTGNARGGGGHIGNRYAHDKRYQIEMDIRFGRYDLLIDNVTKIDEGFYECNDVSDPHSIGSWKLIVIGGEDEQFGSNDVTAIVGETVRLVFMTAKKDSIQLVHESVYRRYPLHVYIDNKLVNNVSTFFGRASFSASNNGSWTLVINDIQMSDAGKFICSEDKGLGQRYAKELVVLRENDVSCSTENETCADEFNVTCKATYAGNSAPYLHFSTDGRIPSRHEHQVIGNSVSIMTVAYRTNIPVCVVATQSTPLQSPCQVPVCKEIATEYVSYLNIAIIIIIIIIVIIIAIVIAVIVVYVIKKKRESSHGNFETVAMREIEQRHEVGEKL